MVKKVKLQVKTLREQIREELESTVKPEERGRRVAKLRANAGAQAFADRKAKDPEIPVAVGLPNGQAVYLGHVQEIEGGVEVWLGNNPNTDLPPAYRIFNPPTLVRDPLGSVEVRGQRYREDPLAAIAEVIASHNPSKKRSVR